MMRVTKKVDDERELRNRATLLYFHLIAKFKRIYGHDSRCTFLQDILCNGRSQLLRITVGGVGIDADVRNLIGR